MILNIGQKERDSKYYDDSFMKSYQYHQHYMQSRYYPMWTVVLDRIKHIGPSNILDLGCGSGQFACLLRDNVISNYIGIDFSSARISHARSICPEYKFLDEDVFLSECLRVQNYDLVIALEFLEHINKDIELINMIKTGTTCIFSVPNFHGNAHVRYFKSGEQVLQRYGKYFNNVLINEIQLGLNNNKIYIFQGIKA